MSEKSLPRDELRAAVEARRDLGPDYESALVESFLDRVEKTIASRVQGEVNAQLTQHPGRRYKSRDPSIAIALGSLGIGVPLTAIASGTTGLAGLLIAWGGIITVNMAHAISRRRRP
ncbi:MAG TPA: hypothetical protein VIR33_18170 [Thermopolyspora sp.]